MIHNCDGNCDGNCNSTEGIFDFVSDEYEREMIETAYNAVKELGLMDWIGSVDLKETGISFFRHPNLIKIHDQIESMNTCPEHSSTSFVLTISVIQSIARNGLEAYKIARLANE